MHNHNTWINIHGTYLTSRNCPVATSSTYPITGISFLKYGDAFNAATSAWMFASTVPGDHEQPENHLVISQLQYTL
jgi:hypothetical protein